MDEDFLEYVNFFRISIRTLIQAVENNFDARKVFESWLEEDES